MVKPKFYCKFWCSISIANLFRNIADGIYTHTNTNSQRHPTMQSVKTVKFKIAGRLTLWSHWINQKRSDMATANRMAFYFVIQRMKKKIGKIIQPWKERWKSYTLQMDAECVSDLTLAVVFFIWSFPFAGIGDFLWWTTCVGTANFQQPRHGAHCHCHR